MRLALALLLVLPMLTFPAAAADDGPRLVLAPHDAVTFDVPAGRAFMLVADVPSDVRVSFKAESTGAAAGGETRDVMLDGRTSDALVGSMSTSSGYSSISTTLTFGPAAPAIRIFVYGVDDGTDDPRRWTLVADAAIEFLTLDLPLHRLEGGEGFEGTQADVGAPLAGSVGVAHQASLELTVAGALYGMFRADAGAAYARDAFAGPGYDEENLHHYVLWGGGAGAWRFDVHLQAGLGGRSAFWLDVPAA